MIDVLRERLKQGYRTTGYPDGLQPALPPRYRGRPSVRPNVCPADCRACAGLCPVDALRVADGSCELDLGKCLFCGACAEACPQHAVTFGDDHRQATRRRQDLKLRDQTFRLADELDDRLRSMFGRSLKVRQVSAGGCNACEADCNVLTTIGWDIGRFGLQFVASPRHADGLLITGPVPENMRLALQKTYEAVPAPKVVIVVGACAISGGPYAGHREVHNGADGLLPVDLYIPGCPPHPLTILDGLLRLLGRLEE